MRPARVRWDDVRAAAGVGLALIVVTALLVLVLMTDAWQDRVVELLSRPLRRLVLPG